MPLVEQSMVLFLFIVNFLIFFIISTSMLYNDINRLLE